MNQSEILLTTLSKSDTRYGQDMSVCFYYIGFFEREKGKKIWISFADKHQQERQVVNAAGKHLSPYDYKFLFQKSVLSVEQPLFLETLKGHHNCLLYLLKTEIDRVLDWLHC